MREMAALESLDSSHNSSFATQATSHRLLRRISKKEPPSFSHFHCSPPRLISPTNLQHASDTPTSLITNSGTTYCCLSSVLKNDGQVLSMATCNGFMYTAGSDSNLIRVWRFPEFTECGQLSIKARNVVALEVTRDKVYAACCDGKIRVWRRTWNGGLKHFHLATIPKTKACIRSFIAGKDRMMKHIGPITSLAISILDDILYSASLDKTVKVWRMSDLKCIETFQAHLQPINAIVVAEDRAVYTASDDATIRIWHRNLCHRDLCHSLTMTLPAKDSPVKTLTLAIDQGVLYGGCTDGYIHYWVKNLSGQLHYGGALQGHTHAVMCITNVSNYVISGSADSTSRVWKRQLDSQHTCLAILVGHRGPIKCISASVGGLGEDNEDECTICTGSLDGVIKMWRVASSNKDDGYLTGSDWDYYNLQ